MDNGAGLFVSNSEKMKPFQYFLFATTAYGCIHNITANPIDMDDNTPLIIEAPFIHELSAYSILMQYGEHGGDIRDVNISYIDGIGHQYVSLSIETTVGDFYGYVNSHPLPHSESILINGYMIPAKFCHVSWRQSFYISGKLNRYYKSGSGTCYRENGSEPLAISPDSCVWVPMHVHTDDMQGH